MKVIIIGFSQNNINLVQQTANLVNNINRLNVISNNSNNLNNLRQRINNLEQEAELLQRPIVQS